MVSPAAILAAADGPNVYPSCDPASTFAAEEAYQEQHQAGGEAVWFLTAVCGGEAALHGFSVLRDGGGAPVVLRESGEPLAGGALVFLTAAVVLIDGGESHPPTSRR
jgi:hypothetical protein